MSLKMSLLSSTSDMHYVILVVAVISVPNKRQAISNHHNNSTAIDMSHGSYHVTKSWRYSDSMAPCDAVWRHRTRKTLVQLITSYLTPPMLTYHRWDHVTLALRQFHKKCLLYHYQPLLFNIWKCSYICQGQLAPFRRRYFQMHFRE